MVRSVLAIAPCTLLVILGASAASADPQPTMPMPSVVNGVLIDPAPKPIQPAAPKTTINVKGAAMGPTFTPPGVQVKVPCGPNVQDGKLVCD